MDSALALDETNHLCNGVFMVGSISNKYVNMIRVKAPFTVMRLLKHL
jgi:hypothetical protein